MATKWESEKENLVHLILEEKVSYEEIGRKYGCTGANIKKVAKRLGIPLELRRILSSNEVHTKKIYKCLNCGKELDTKRKYCNSSCLIEHDSKEYLSKWKLGLVSGHDARYKLSPYIRKYLLEKHSYCCELCDCNWKNPETGLSILQIHHIDGDASNTKEDNLLVLCPNHHAMTDNFGSRNDSSVREYRKLDYIKSEQLTGPIA